ncbi:MAG: hypothetical protein IH946_12590 [Bacteroidetes bacterium]|nr:hypothetical protein [Bacteroidota bacterium]
MENNKNQNFFSKFEKPILLALGFLLTSVVGGALGHHFQNRTWEKEHADFHQHSEKESAKAIFDELSLSSGTRLYQMRRIIWAVEANLDEAMLNERWNLYQETLKDWNYSLLRNLALLEYSFGKDMRETFHDRIQRKFGELNSLLNDRSDNDKAAKMANDLANDLSEEIGDFNIKMVGMIQRVEVGQFIGHDE